jgi:hypothetical protein
VAVTAARPDNMALRLRILGWLQSAPTVNLNERVLDASAAPGVEMRRPMDLRWKSCRMILTCRRIYRDLWF